MPRKKHVAVLDRVSGGVRDSQVVVLDAGGVLEGWKRYVRPMIRKVAKGEPLVIAIVGEMEADGSAAFCGSKGKVSRAALVARIQGQRQQNIQRPARNKLGDVDRARLDRV